ncbi:hypothetical protein PFICI_09761 [Pestalotiopsis fici W106-1]|uniref:Uncharacterized protein n=1 Tax=Pestalotiopsis fici (strain W106-1 / CGMCC3.15140) TaxID=1229662 RepID=W3WV47_PESFW|nr:uncharacterized protein PFICI_09761 [Pestalotiopsis fici W106-1]ETS77699.1 hypothetical protein PFICI_09761 [Pestalotiopsis fici W106-1]
MSTSYDRYTWHQTSPEIWQRDVDEIELFYYSLAKRFEGSGRMFFAMTGHLSLSVELHGQTSDVARQRIKAALKRGWQALRYEHPTIASQVSHNVTTGHAVKTYHLCNSSEKLDLWLGETLVEIPGGQTGEEWANSDPPAPKLPTMFLLELTDNTSDFTTTRIDLVFRSPHEIVDGIGTLHMFNNFTKLVANAYKDGDAFKLPSLDGTETENLSPPFRVAARVPFELTDRQQKHLAEQNAHKAAAGKDEGDIRVIGLHFDEQGPKVPGVHQRVALDFSQSETKFILTACKKLGATVTHAFHAAIALSVRDLQERTAHAQKVRYVNYILRNERKSCDPPYNSPSHAVSVYHSVSGRALTVDMVVPAATSTTGPADTAQEFHSAVNKIKAFYNEVRDDADHYVLCLPIWAAGMSELPQSTSPPPIPAPNAKPTVSISSMGSVDNIIEQRHGDIAVHNPWVTGEELGTGLGLFLGTFEGKLCLSAAYNDAWHSKYEVLDFLQRCTYTVRAGLGAY